MSFIDEGSDIGIGSDAEKMANILKGPETKVEGGEAELPVVPRPKLQSQRNTVAPQPQESAPEEVSAGEETEDITPPSSWDAEAKEKWAKLPPDVREIISHREAERERAINTRLQETAELRKAAEADQAQTLQYRQAYEQRLNVLAKQLESNIPQEFRAIQTTTDLQQLAERDPAAAQRFMIWRETATNVLGELDQLEQHKAQQFREAQNAQISREASALVEKWPEIADSVKGPALRDEITSTLKGFGFNDSEIAGIADHRILLFARQYLQGQKALKAQEKAAGKVTAKPLPRVVAPGKGEATGPAGPGMSKANLHRVASSGDLSSTQAALERLLRN